MTRRVTPTQFRSQVRQAQAKRRQALNKLRSDLRNLDRAIANYNSAARQHNARVRANQERLRRELARLSTTSRTTQRVTFHTSVVTVQRRFERIEDLAIEGRWVGGEELFDLIEGETANSVATLNVLEGKPVVEDSAENNDLGDTRITSELAKIHPDFDARWRGALYALNPVNPDAARHFCTSARELVDAMLHRLAPDQAVVAALPNYERTDNGSISRRARIRYCLVRAGRYSPEIHDFADADLENVVQLFGAFNKGTHGSAGRFTIGQLKVIKRRVEDAILFLHTVAHP